MRCFVFTLLAVATVSVVQAENEAKCVPGELLMSFCNACICNADGTDKACTRKHCPEGVYNEDGSLRNPNRFLGDLPSRVKRNANNDTVENCEPHELFHKFCNTCICTSDGKNATCTKKECPEGVYNEDGSRKPGEKVCEPFSHFKVNCDDCWCSSSGQMAMCTDLSCAEVPCEPGKVTKNGCDECTCNKSGTQNVCIAKYCRDPLDPRNDRN